MRIAIPSYKRYEILNSNTLNYLINVCKVDKNIIDVFVADEHEYSSYKKTDKFKVNYIIGKPTLRGQRNFMDFYYEVDEQIIFFDDDIVSCCKRISDKKATLFTDILSLGKIGFSECIKKGTKLWGINAHHNPFYMKNNISYNLKFISGAVYGQIITRDPTLLVALEEKEDYERTILYFHKYKAVVRFNGIGEDQPIYTLDGGMKERRTWDEQNKSAHYLVKKWPDYISINPKRKSKYTELKLNHRAV